MDRGPLSGRDRRIIKDDSKKSKALFPVHRNPGQRILGSFPYSVIFQEKQDIILIVAVAHAKRR